MRILFHSWEFGPGTGGIGQYLYQIALAVKNLGHEVVVVCGRSGQNDQILAENIGTIYRLYEKQNLGTRSTALDTLKIAEKHQIDIIEGSDHNGECAPIISLTNRPKVVIKYHGCQVIEALTNAGVIYPWQRLTIAVALWKIRQQCQREKICLELPDAAMAPSQKIINDLQVQKIRIPHSVPVIPNILSDIPDLSKSAGESSNPTLLFVGKIEARKGIQYLPAIFKAVCRVYPNAVLEIAGGDQYAKFIGSLKNWLERQFGPVGKNVRFLGALKPIELDQAYRRCWMLVFPTKWDNFPMSVLEAMSYAKPVVTTYEGGMPEMLAGTGSPIAKPDSKEFQDGILRLIGDRNLRYQIGEACRQKVLNTYMPDQVIPQYLGFLNNLL